MVDGNCEIGQDMGQENSNSININPDNYDEGIIGQAQYQFDSTLGEAKNKLNEVGEKYDEAKEEVLRRAPDQCKQQ